MDILDFAQSFSDDPKPFSVHAQAPGLLSGNTQFRKNSTVSPNQKHPCRSFPRRRESNFEFRQPFFQSFQRISAYAGMTAAGGYSTKNQANLIYSGLNLNQDKATKPQTVQIVRQGEATPYWFKVNPLYMFSQKPKGESRWTFFPACKHYRRAGSTTNCWYWSV